MPLALYLLTVAVFAMGTSEFMLAGLVPDIATGLDVSIGTAGLLTSAFAVGMIVGAPATAAFTRRWPARATLLGCVVVFALCHVGAPTMGGSYATAALNVGAASGPAAGAAALSVFGVLAPVWVAATLTAIALLIILERRYHRRPC